MLNSFFQASKSSQSCEVVDKKIIHVTGFEVVDKKIVHVTEPKKTVVKEEEKVEFKKAEILHEKVVPSPELQEATTVVSEKVVSDVVSEKVVSDVEPKKADEATVEETNMKKKREFMEYIRIKEDVDDPNCEVNDW